MPLARTVDDHARERGAALAFAGVGVGPAEPRADASRMTWREYAERSDRVASALLATGLARGERVAVWMPDGPGVHAVYLGCEKAGLVVVGIGPRAGLREVRHLLGKSGARALVSRAEHRDVDLRAFAAAERASGGLAHHLVVAGELEPEALLGLDGATVAAAGPPARDRALGDGDLFLLNSTSGTTGLPKCVTHDQRRWLAFHAWAVEAGALGPRDVFLSALPAPFGFGIWTAHVTPTLLGAPTVLCPRFDAGDTLRAIAEHRVSVLAAVSTQFILLLEALDAAAAKPDLGSLRVLFTGGEAVPYEKAARFEDATGARVLQFYGSNETGALSRTTLADSRDVRLRTAGHVIPAMQVRLFDDSGRDVTATGRGQAGCRGPATSRGYWNDDAANAKLYTADGWMLTGDVCEIAEGVLRVVGRKADFIIRGGKNVSAAEVEAEAATHPAVAIAAAVAMPDPTFGERVCLYVELRPGAPALTLDALVAHLAARELGKESFPERLVVMDELPRASGGKIAKAELREDARRRAASGEGADAA